MLPLLLPLLLLLLLLMVMVVAGWPIREGAVLAAKDIPKVQRLGVQDPYVVINHAGASRRTRTCNNGGQNPVFHHETHSLPLDPSKPLEVVLFNDRGMRDELIGTAQCVPPPLPSRPLGLHPSRTIPPLSLPHSSRL